MRMILGVVFLLVISFAAVAQAPEVTLPMGMRSVGLSGGAISTVGLTFRSWSPRAGIQVTAGGYFYPAQVYGLVDQYPELYYSVAVAGDLVLISGNVFAWRWLFSQLYLFGSASHLGEDTYQVVYDETGTIVTLVGQAYVPRFRLAVGIGSELVLFSRFSFSGEIGYAATWSPTFTRLVEQFQAALVGQGSIQYRF